MAKVKRSKSNTTAFRKAVADVRKYTASAGWNESAKYADGTPVAGVAAVQEFGSPKTGTPPRPIMRNTIEANKNEWKDLSKDLFRSVARGELDAKTVYGILGAKAAGDVRKTISTVSTPPLSPVTLALRRLKKEGRTVDGALVFAVMRAVAMGLTGPGDLGYGGGVSKKPLVDDGIMINTLSHEVKER